MNFELFDIGIFGDLVFDFVIDFFSVGDWFLGFSVRFEGVYKVFVVNEVIFVFVKYIGYRFYF